MNKTKIYFYCALILTLVVTILLATGSPLLTLALNKEESIPLGTLITWIGLISLPLTMYWGIKELREPSGYLNKFLSGILKIIIVLGFLWAPISYLLAGNLTFSFYEKETFQGGQMAMKWFWYLSYGIAIGALFTLFTYWVSMLIKRIQNDSPN